MRIDGRPDGADFRLMAGCWGLMHRHGVPSLWRYDGSEWSHIADLDADLDGLVEMLEHYRRTAPRSEEERER
jgi:hypothetical protein